MYALGKLLRSFSFIVTVWTLALGASAYGGIEKNFEEEYSVKSGGELTVSSNMGAIEVIGGNGDKVSIRVELEADTRNESKAKKIFDDFEIEFEQSGNDVFIDGEYYGNKNNFWGSGRNRLKIRYYVQVPSNYNVDLKTGGGSISVTEIDGDVKTKTSGGSLSFEKIKGEIYGKTSGGSIWISECDGIIDAHTSGGGIDVDRTSGEVQIKTSGGSINVDDVSGYVDASTSGGSISAALVGQPTDDCRFTTSGGSITVELDPDANLYLNANTSVGRVSSDFSVESKKVKRSKYKRDRSSLKGNINDGGPELYLRTSAGSIRIREK